MLLCTLSSEHLDNISLQSLTGQHSYMESSVYPTADHTFDHHLSHSRCSPRFWSSHGQEAGAVLSAPSLRMEHGHHVDHLASRT